jgi:hypothetical protein
METMKNEVRDQTTEDSGFIPTMNYSFVTTVDREWELREKLGKFCSKYSKKLDAVFTITSEKVKLNQKGVIRNECGDPDAYALDGFKFTIDFKMPSLRFEGYEHVATLKIESLEDGGAVNLVFPAKKYEKENFTRYFVEAFRCDHCKTVRGRKIVHLWRNEAGSDLMIASTCSKEYFGESVWKALRGFENYSPDMIGADFEMEFGGGGSRGWYDTRDRVNFAKLAFGYMMHTNRYVSQSKASQYDKMSTTSEINYLVTPISRSGLSDADWLEMVQEQKDKRDLYNKVADEKGFDIVKIKEFWDAKLEANPEDNFTRNCWINFSLEKVRYGLFTYAVFAYCKEVLDFGKDKTAGKPSEYVGEVGKRLKGLKLKVVFVTSFETAFGVCFLMKMTDEAGNVFVWKTGNGLEQDKEYVLDGTVKEHSEYKGTKNTVLTRCKVKE